MSPFHLIKVAKKNAKIQEDIKSFLFEAVNIQSFAGAFKENMGSMQLTDMPDFHQLEAEQFDKELSFLCVKFSSISHSIDSIGELGSYILQCISQIKPPVIPHLIEKHETNRQILVNSAYKFVKDAKRRATKAQQVAACNMACQLLRVQLGSFFGYQLYARGRVPSTTGKKLGLFDRIADFLNICSDHLTESDLTKIVCGVAHVFSQEMEKVFIGKHRRLFTLKDHELIAEDCQETLKLFSDFGLGGKLCFEDETNPSHGRCHFYGERRGKSCIYG